MTRRAALVDMLEGLTADERRDLRAQHDCTLKTTSIGCRACDRGVPYPPLTIDEVKEALADGRREATAAGPALRATRRPR